MKDTEIQTISHYLENRKITIVSGGGIAAVEIPRLARELRRHGASTQICMTENCLKFVGLDSMRWASQNEVILSPTGLSEHICTSDIVIVAPATADLISKIANGICCDAATTLVQSALGTKKVVIFCQTMHDSLANSPIIANNKLNLKKLENVFFIDPRKEEGKQKIPDIETLAMSICHISNKNIRKVKEHMLITYGGTRIKIDPVRCITNMSTGATGIEVAKLFYGMGYSLTVLAASTTQSLPLYDGIDIHHLPDYFDMFNFASNLNPKKYDGLIHLVAASDFSPVEEKKQKIKSETEKLDIIFTKTKKLLSHTKLKDIPFIAAGKLTSKINEDGMEEAMELLKKHNLNAVLWNKAADAWNGKNTHHGVFLEKQNKKIIQTIVHDKKSIGTCFFNAFENRK